MALRCHEELQKKRVICDAIRRSSVLWLACLCVFLNHTKKVLVMVSQLLSFCEGWRPVVHGTSTLTEWAVARFALFGFSAILRGLASRCLQDAIPHRIAEQNGTPTLAE